MTTPFCSTCGAPNTPFARFCDACGTRRANAGGVRCARCGQTALPGDRFCDECGAGLGRTALFILDETGWRIALPNRPEVVIGREDVMSGAAPDVDLGPHGAETYGISRSHARLLKNGNGYRLEDLGSVNLTYINDQRLEPSRPVPLKDGDRIMLGRLRLIFRQT